MRVFRFTFRLAVVLLGIASASGAELASETVRVLFLGDRGHHKPAERFAQLQPVLSQRGFEFSYTESVDDLNPARLATVDCVLIYANITRISPEQEKALMDFVSAGGGLAPIHCASYCFHNSTNYIELVGAQFRRHGAGVFQETIVNSNHPVMHGLEPIESWDETYVHHRHNTNRIVLAERRDSEGAEPWTWVREHGKGRVFYTAWGHDHRTWSNPGFHALVENGIRWAAAHSPNRIRARSGLKPLEYVSSSTPIPNYLPDRNQAQIQSIQKPLEPADSMKRLVTLPGFELSLFAAEPDIVKPIWLAWDARGRLWIAETVDYPNELRPDNQGRDRIKILEDTNGDGRADKFTVFVDGLSIPTGFVFVNGGIIVIHSGKTEFLRDTNGDDKADERKVLFEGWDLRDTHATASNLRYGFDGWIWGTIGYSGFRGTVGGKEISFGQGIFRFKPDGSALEFVRSSNNNTWGLGLTEDNLIFGSTANNNASIYMPIPNRYYEQVRGWSAARMETIADSQRIYPLTDKVRQVDAHGRFTAGSGSAIYTARQFPMHYWNRAQFVSEPTGHLLGQFFLEPRGSGFMARNARSFLASDDEWTAPVCAEVGPDGALWVVDWYNYIVQHNPTPQGFETGKGNAYETPLRDKVHGRIYRVAYASAPNVNPAENAAVLGVPANATGAALKDAAIGRKLVAALKNDNLLWRLHAQRLLIERQQTDVVPALCELVRDTSVDAIGLNAGAVHALWTLRGLGVLEPSEAVAANAAARKADHTAVQAASNALTHPSAAVRRAAVTVLPRNAAGRDAILKSTLLSDADAQVRLASFLALAEMPTSSDAGAAVLAALQKAENANDTWIAHAATAAGARHSEGFLKAVLASQSFEKAETVTRLVAAHYAASAPTEIVSIVAGLSNTVPAAYGAILDGFIAGWPTEHPLEITAAQRKSLQQLMRGMPESSHDRLLGLAQRWGTPDVFGVNLSQIVESLKARVSDATLSDSDRIAAAQRLVGLNGSPEVLKAILAQVTLLTPPDLANGLVNAIGEFRGAPVDTTRTGSGRRVTRQAPTNSVAEALIERWSQYTPAVRRTALSVLMRRPDWTIALLNAVENGGINRTDLAPEHWSQLRQSQNPFIARRARQLAGAVSSVSSGREEIVAKFLPLASEKGDPIRGREVYTANCAACHLFNGEGRNVGPDLNGIAARDRADILIEILDPNRSVEANYRSWTVETKDGETYSGKLVSESQTAIEILDTAAQKHVIQRKDILSLEASSQSIMPIGFEALSPDDLKALLEYLTQPQAMAAH